MADFKYIELSDGSLTKVDNSDYEYLNRWKWNNVGGYAVRQVYPSGLKGSAYRVLMHRVVTACPDKLLVDHINHDTLDNTSENLRFATKSQNQWNRLIAKNNTSGYTGINWDKVNKKWRVAVKANYKYKNIGRFEKLEDAVAARDKALRELHGDFARVS